MTPMRAVFFDVGETLIDETRMWAEWAWWLGVPCFTFFALLGSLIEGASNTGRSFICYGRGLTFRERRLPEKLPGVPTSWSQETCTPMCGPAYKPCERRGT